MLTAAETQRRRHDALSLCVALRRHKIRCVCSFRAAWRGGDSGGGGRSEVCDFRSHNTELDSLT